MNLSPVVKEFLKSLNSGRTSIESLPIADDRNVLPKTACLFVYYGDEWFLGDYPTHKRMVRDLI